MVIKHALPMLALTLLPVSVCGVAFGAEGPAAPSKSVDYKRADTILADCVPEHVMKHI